MSMAGLFEFARKDVNLQEKLPTKLLRDLHSNFILQYERDKNGYHYIMAEHLRVSGIYWCANAMDLTKQLSQMSADEIVQYVLSCRNSDGGYGPAPGHDSHLLHTLCAVQTLIIFDSLQKADSNSICDYVKKLQNEDGSFCGDLSGEVDTRFTLCSLATCHLLGNLSTLNIDTAVNFLLRCYNSDGGFGTRPGSESHAGQVYCCVGALAIAGRLDSISRDRTAEWLAFRQCDSGGLNGRPEKLPDVCYSWWVLASLAILGRLDFIDQSAMKKFIYACQDDETGGFADRPGDCADPFHTVFGIAALSLFGDDSLEQVDPIFCMSKKCLGSKQIEMF
uniref:Geranylgeranyl transferase type-2 subunit beta n=1 Tax=Caenorhabditis tropicalis TaxID=1561998 RepID=A0A1I7SYX3_9PELO